MSSRGWTGQRIVPSDWNSLKTKVMRRDRGICYVCGQSGADQVDHVVNIAEGGTHDLGNLAAIHGEPCHREKTRQEIARGHARRPRAKRQPEPHPGLLP
ncbi:MAG: HNH endonuclease [Nocardioidaceae bacterium]